MVEAEFVNKLGILFERNGAVIQKESQVCLFTRLLRAETHLGPGGTRLEQNAQARL